MENLGTESLLGDPEGEDAQTLRDRLALSTRYLANWYRATESSAAKTISGRPPDQAVWWAKIDLVRRKIELAYQDLLNPLSQYFAGPVAKADYQDASNAWAQLYRELLLSVETIDASLIDVAADFGDMLAHSPALLVASVGNEAGKAIGGALGLFLAKTWPYLVGAGVLFTIYIFRVPLVRAVGKVAA
jgi:hypothetical protein